MSERDSRNQGTERGDSSPDFGQAAWPRTPEVVPDEASHLEWCREQRVQFLAEPMPTLDDLSDGKNAAVHKRAQEGVSGPGQALPHADQIQASFGTHDISHIKAHVGGDAATAAGEIGAQAYATGDQVAFVQPPDLHTAAHEAAHVVQQRGGVSLKGGVGQAGDPYERHADAVADKVVAGESAADLLDSHTGSAASMGIVQRFEEPEHADIGIKGAQAAGVTSDVNLADGYKIPLGEIVALAGDWFTSIDEMRQLATKPGPGVGTRQEIEYVRIVKIQENKSREPEFSDGVKDACAARFNRLALKNRSHFSHSTLEPPEWSDAQRANAGVELGGKGAKSLAQILEHLIDRHGEGKRNWGMSGAETPEFINAAGGYRYHHIRAIAEATLAGQVERDYHVNAGPRTPEQQKRFDNGAMGMGTALATDGFGCHFLTDMFSAGHVRTERSSVKDYWNALQPMFFENLKGLIAQEIAVGLEGKVDILGIDLSPGTIFDPPIVDGAYDKVREKLDSAGALGWGDIMSGVLHDYDNKHGLAVTSDGRDATVFGDGQAGKGDEKSLAIKAVASSFRDVQTAYTESLKGSSLDDVMSSLLSKELFGAEHLVPKAKPDEQQTPERKRIDWMKPNVDALMTDPRFVEELEGFLRAKAGRIADVAASLGKDEKAAMQTRVVDELKARPISTLYRVFNWVPTVDRSNPVHGLEYWRKVQGTHWAAQTLTLPQRNELIVQFMARSQSDGTYAEAIVAILTAASPHDRKMLFMGLDRDKIKARLPPFFAAKLDDLGVA